ncbi:MAG TPA: carboxypeptidase regulatory-like domain-containing protein [Bryobacteraceae bacterium]
MHRKSLLLLVLTTMVVCACGSHATSSEETTTLPMATVDEANGATISGKVAFTGEKPKMPAIDMSANPMCERQHKTPQLAETVVINPNGTIRYAFVWIKSGLPKARWNSPQTNVVLDQNGCVYRPHVLALMVGQQLEIDNSDPVNHNVHAEAQVNVAWNESQPPQADKKFKTFPREEIWFPVTCSVHPWMRAYMSVVSHPFFAVTGEDGTFTLKGVPPGNYTLEVIQEKFGRQTQAVTVAAHDSKTVDFTYAQ